VKADWFFRPGKWKGCGKGPLITLKEACAEFGVSTNSVGAMMKNDPNRPKPVLSKRTRASKSAQWYNPEELRAWLASKLGRRPGA